MRCTRIGAAVVFLAIGCAKLDKELTFDVPVEGKSYVIEPARRQQKVKVTATATGSPIDVFVFLEKDRDAAEKDILRKKYSGIILAHVEKTEQAKLEATVPANSAAVVMVHRAGVKTPSVILKLSN